MMPKVIKETKTMIANGLAERAAKPKPVGNKKSTAPITYTRKTAVAKTATPAKTVAAVAKPIVRMPLDPSAPGFKSFNRGRIKTGLKRRLYDKI
jgi:hypothetical protein